MKNYILFLMVSSALLSLTGCSTIFGDNDRIIHVNSAPKGAKVTVNSMETDSSTPTQAVVTNMWAPTIIKVQKPGCAPKTVIIQPEFQKIGLLNILLFPGFIVDAVTGDMMKIPANQHNIDVHMCWDNL